MTRLQKILAHAGIASRREAEKMILSGRIKVNGQVVTEPGTKADPAIDRIEVDGRPISEAEKKVYYVLNKPRGYVTTMKDPQGRPSVIDLLGQINERTYPVGRLDYDTSGLLLITNDGELANALAHPRKEIEKCYLARLIGIPSEDVLKRLREGILLEDGMTAAAKVRVLEVKDNTSWVEIIIHEGRNRQIRRMCDAVNHKVVKLKRTRFGPLEMGDVRPGKLRELTIKEIRTLKKATE